MNHGFERNAGMDAQALVLIAEDEPEIVDILKAYLAREGIRSAWAADGRAALEMHVALKPDLVLLDVRMPYVDGWQVLSEVRARGQTPVIMVTAHDQDIDKLMALRIGADDYVVKPFEPRELVARVRSILRRREEATGHQGQVAVFGEWRFNPCNNALRGPGGTEEILSTAEGELLQVFLRNPNRILNREQLMGGRDVSPTDRAIDVRISRLRKRLEPQESSPALIKTVYGAGYLFLAQVRWDDSP